MAVDPLTVRDLRRLWKPHKERLSNLKAEHPTAIRFHRACSWLQRADEADQEDLDLAVLCQWTAFNALYGQWDHGKRMPVPDMECWKHFIERMVELDAAKHIADTLMDHRPLVLTILEDKYVSSFYWKDPGEQSAHKVRKVKYEAQSWYLNGNWAGILERLIERIYFVRGQLVHGAATFNSKVNRSAVRQCAMAMSHLLRTFLRVWIEFGADEDWGILCYPPLRAGATSPARRPANALRAP